MMIEILQQTNHLLEAVVCLQLAHLALDVFRAVRGR